MKPNHKIYHFPTGAILSIVHRRCFWPSERYSRRTKLTIRVEAANALRDLRRNRR